MKMKLSFYWNNGCWRAGAEKSAVIRDQPQGGEIWKAFLQAQNPEAVVHGESWPHLKLAAELGSV